MWKYLVRAGLLLELWLAALPAGAEVTTADINACLNRGLRSILSAEDIARYAIIPNITKNIVGPQWQQLSDGELQELEAVVLAVMTTRLRERGTRYRNATALAEESHIKASVEHKNRYSISGTIYFDGVPYWFETIAFVTEERCSFYTLNVENVFTLSGWLREQTAIQAKLEALGLKQ